jgi:hypothetical protein
MIRKGQAYCSGAGAEVGLLHRLILGLFAARTELPIIYPTFSSTTKLQHIHSNYEPDHSGIETKRQAD